MEALVPVVEVPWLFPKLEAAGIVKFLSGATLLLQKGAELPDT